MANIVLMSCIVDFVLIDAISAKLFFTAQYLISDFVGDTAISSRDGCRLPALKNNSRMLAGSRSIDMPPLGFESNDKKVLSRRLADGISGKGKISAWVSREKLRPVETTAQYRLWGYSRMQQVTRTWQLRNTGKWVKERAWLVSKCDLLGLRSLLLTTMKCMDNIFTLVYLSLVMLEISSSKCQSDTVDSTMVTVPSNCTFGRFPRRVTEASNNTVPSTINLRHRSPEFVLKRIANHENVERLVLEHDKLTYLPRTVAGLTGLRSVSLSDNRIANIANVSFLNELPRLQKLTLSENPLKSLKGLRVYTLQTLEAQRCAIEEIDDILPNSLPALVTLNLTGNPLGTVRKLISETLTELVLKDCRLKNVSSDSFEGLTNLTLLDLRDNELHTLPDDVFSENNNLRHLILGNNSLEDVRNAWFNETRHLVTLDLSVNKIVAVNESAFAALLNLMELSLEANRLSSLGNLRTAAVHANFSRNSITNQELWDLSEMGRIRRLDLSHNRLSGECGAFRSMSMSILILGYNNISSITKSSLVGLPNLTDLNIKGNRFSTGIEPSIFEDNRMLRNVELDDNPWTCDCPQMYRMYLYLASGQRTNTGRLICRSPRNASGQTWWDFCAADWRELMVAEDQVELSKNWMIAISAVFGACLIFGTMVYITYTFKKNRSQRRISV